MIFSSVYFLYIFLPLFFLCYFSSPRKYKNIVALLFSLLFYSWGAPLFFLTFNLLVLFNFFAAKLIARVHQFKKTTFIFSLLINISVLFYYKYLNFVILEINEFVGFWNLESIQQNKIILPIGLSFVIFECISYLADVFRETSKPTNSYIKFSLFVSLFPHAIAGPIFRWHDIEKQFDTRIESVKKFTEGCCRFSIGLGKKVLLANNLAILADNVFAFNPQDVPSIYLFLGAVAYSFQIYFDFSGYTDMAIGLGKMIGFDFKENFNRPYLSKTVSEFWKRWHISLSYWLRDYVYIPLGGNEGTNIRYCFNIMTVFLISGIWHGANWTFIVWGLYFGALTIIDRYFLNRLFIRLPCGFDTIITFVIVTFGWILFRADSISHATNYFVSLSQNIFLIQNELFFINGKMIKIRDLIELKEIIILIIAMLICFVGEKYNILNNRNILKIIVSLFCIFLSTLYLLNDGYNPFLYFKF